MYLPAIAGHLPDQSVHVFFSVQFRGVVCPCAYVGNDVDPVTGMWRVRPDYDRQDNPILAIISVDSIFCAAHLIGVCGSHCIPRHNFDHSKSLNSFESFYVNKYADHHAHEIAF